MFCHSPHWLDFLMVSPHKERTGSPQRWQPLSEASRPTSAGHPGRWKAWRTAWIIRIVRWDTVRECHWRPSPAKKTSREVWCLWAAAQGHHRPLRPRCSSVRTGRSLWPSTARLFPRRWPPDETLQVRWSWAWPYSRRLPPAPSGMCRSRHWWSDGCPGCGPSAWRRSSGSRGLWPRAGPSETSAGRWCSCPPSAGRHLPSDHRSSSCISSPGDYHCGPYGAKRRIVPSYIATIEGIFVRTTKHNSFGGVRKCPWC